MPTRPPAGYQMRPKRRRLKIELSDIESAKATSSTQCAIARAIARQVEGASHISVDVATIRFTEGERRFYYSTPPEAQRFIIHFDLGENGEPFDLNLITGTAHDVARRKGVGGVPKGPRTVARNRVPVRGVNSTRRTYGARSMTGTPAAAKAMSHA